MTKLVIKNKKNLHILLILSAVIFFFGYFSQVTHASLQCESRNFSGLICYEDPNNPTPDPRCASLSAGATCGSLGIVGDTVTVGGQSAIVNAVKNLISIDMGSTVANFLTGYLLTWAGWFISWTAFFLDTLVHALNVFPPVVQTAWTILRNFANLFFILILIVVAFATIFDSQKYNWKAILPKFIIAALLINFSYVIGTTIIDTSNTISKALLGQVVNDGGSISVGFMDATNIQKYVANSGTGFTNSAITGFAAGSQLTLTVIFIIAFIIILALTFLTASIFLIARMVVLWFLLIFSPIAWLASILPDTRKFTSQWWSEFLGWTFFPLIYFFFLAIGMGFVKARYQFNKFPNSGSTGDTLSAVFGLNDFIFYLLTLTFVGGGLFFAKKFGSMFGGSAVSYAGKIQGQVQNFTRYNAVKKGVTDTAGRIQREGLSGKGRYLYGGEAGQKRQAEGVGRFLQKGMGYSVIKAEKDKVSQEEERLKLVTEHMLSQDRDKYLKHEFENGSKFRQRAAGKLLDQDKKLTYDEQIDLWKKLGGDTSEEARQFMKKVDYSKWDKESRQRFLDLTNDADLKRVMVTAQAKFRDLVTESAETLTGLTTFFTTENEKLNFLATVFQRGNKEASAQAVIDLKLRDESGNIITDLGVASEHLGKMATKQEKQQALADLGKAIGGAVNLPKDERQDRKEQDRVAQEQDETEQGSSNKPKP